MRLARVFFPLALVLLACTFFSPRPPATPPGNPITGETLPALPTPTVEGTPPQVAATVPAANVTLSPGNFTPILYRSYLSQNSGFQVVGGVQNGVWLPASALANQVQSQQSFDIYAPDGYAGVAVTSDNGAPLDTSPCGETFIGSDYSSDAPALIGVAQGWKVTFRPYEETPVTTPVYVSAVTDWLMSQGVTLPYVKITRIVRTDLEGDGVEEVLISATSFSDPNGSKSSRGDYSIILMRKLINQQVVTVPVVADLYTSPNPAQDPPLAYYLASLYDLNQDGVLDVIVDVTRGEGNGVIIYEIDGTNVTEALRAVCTK